MFIHSHKASVMTVFEQIKKLLDEQAIEYDVSHHEPVYTSEEAARVRGVSLQSGAKALICKCDKEMFQFVIPADMRLAGREVRRQFGWRKLRFATPEEVLQITSLKPGSIPPFGSLFGLSTYCDKTLLKNPRINFNAGEHAISISMRCDDYIQAEKPHLGTIAEVAPPS
ncbi:MAG: YbaK/EbsC family protein [Rubripirellula sp.]|nr:YbaK/EbsC family protein [Rubripirellula sp.]